MSAEPLRDFVGYGPRPPDPLWPEDARLALVFVVNVEEGAEPSIPDGDPATEPALTDAVPGEVPPGTRDLVAESLFEYGSRVGFWRILRAFRERKLDATFGVCAQALERNAEIARALRDGEDDVCAHGRRFARHWTMDEDTERAEIAAALARIEAHLGRPPTGWQSRYSASVATRRLLGEHAALLYDADAYNDDLPYWTRVGTAHRLVVPHSFTNNDNRLGTARLPTGEDFFDHLRAAFRVLHEEGGRMMTVSLHPRVSGQPSRFDGLRHFLDLVRRTPGVWVASRGAVARHWRRVHPPREPGG